MDNTSHDISLPFEAFYHPLGSVMQANDGTDIYNSWCAASAICYEAACGNKKAQESVARLALRTNPQVNIPYYLERARMQDRAAILTLMNLVANALDDHMREVLGL